jgi:hypothetical protein
MRHKKGLLAIVALLAALLLAIWLLPQMTNLLIERQISLHPQVTATPVPPEEPWAEEL